MVKICVYMKTGKSSIGNLSSVFYSVDSYWGRYKMFLSLYYYHTNHMFCIRHYDLNRFFSG
jgi:hypothetical protein